jgi:hypothetical protein
MISPYLTKNLKEILCDHLHSPQVLIDAWMIMLYVQKVNREAWEISENKTMASYEIM